MEILRNRLREYMGEKDLSVREVDLPLIIVPPVE